MTEKREKKKPPFGPYSTAAEEPIRRLIDWLNDGSGDLRVVRNLLEMSQRLSRLSRTSPKAPSRLFSDLLEDINVSLAGYKGVRTVFVHKGGVGAFWGLPDVELTENWNDLVPEQRVRSTEHRMIHILVDALEHGSIVKIGSCRCGKFFYARSSAVRFCSPKCRVDFWESSPERIAQKRKNAREYYRLHKTQHIK